MIIITRMIIVMLLNVRTPEVPLVEKNGVEIWNVKSNSSIVFLNGNPEYLSFALYSPIISI